jgi:hypothetical protein
MLLDIYPYAVLLEPCFVGVSVTVTWNSFLLPGLFFSQMLPSWLLGIVEKSLP